MRAKRRSRRDEEQDADQVLSLSLAQFLAKYHISHAKYRQVHLDWSDLKAIHADHESRKQDLEFTAEHLAKKLLLGPHVHAVKSRVKNAEHVVEKVIRESIKVGAVWAHRHSYRDKMHDLVGARALLLFNDEWPMVHDYISTTWVRQRPPIAKVRPDDPQYLKDMFRKKRCRIEATDGDYRSVHYHVRFRATREVVVAEVQVRTLFEEARSEVDHKVRYPYDMQNQLLADWVQSLSSVAGQGDLMASAIRDLKLLVELKRDRAPGHRRAQQELKKSFEEKLSHLEKMSPALVRHLLGPPRMDFSNVLERPRRRR
jgi:putative GTP pyrophosphokinase